MIDFKIRSLTNHKMNVRKLVSNKSTKCVCVCGGGGGGGGGRREIPIFSSILKSKPGKTN